MEDDNTLVIAVMNEEVIGQFLGNSVNNMSVVGLYTTVVPVILTIASGER